MTTSPMITPHGTRSAPPMTLVPGPRQRQLHGWAAWAPLVAGAWLAVSIFVWPHSRGATTSSMLLGVCLAGAAAVALYAPGVTWLVGAIAVLTAVSMVFVDYLIAATMLNQGIVALVALSAVALTLYRRRRR